jgi:chemotaxis protein CheD
MLALNTRVGAPIVVGIADVAVSSDPDARIVTYGLGSCLGICIHDPVAGVAGMVHVMLPSAAADPERAKVNPARFVDSGVSALFKAAYALGASKGRVVLRVAGGARVACTGHDSFEIGKRNILMLKKVLWHNGVLIKGSDVGGTISRTVTLHVGSGAVSVKSGEVDRPI